jgi:MazG family protein
MARLRDPEGGCPWDLEQSFETIAPYTIEEAYEVADAIASGHRGVLLEELGDLLFQVVYYAQMSREEGGFDFGDIAECVTSKMIRRHPHVFGDASVADAADQTRAWEEHKAAERSGKGAHGEGGPRTLAGVARALPALVRAEKLTRRAARVGFDWETTDQVFAKIEEELSETRAEIDSDGAPERLKDEVGDLLFAVANLARKLDVDPEAALRGTNDKFTARFAYIEERLDALGKTPAESDLAEMDRLWNAAKRAETGKAPPGGG